MNLSIGISFICILILLGINVSFAQDKVHALEESLNKTTSQDSSRVDILNELSYEYYSSNPQKSKIYAEQALKLAKEIGSQKGLAIAHRNLGNYYWVQGEYDKSLENNFKSLKMLEVMGNKKETARTLNSIALVYRDISDYAPALEYFNRSFDIIKELKDTLRTGILLNNIGGVEIRQGKYRAALVNLLHANSIFKSLKDQSRLATNLNNIGYLFLKEGNFKGAFDYLSKAYAIDSIANDKTKMALNLNGLGQAYLIKKNYKAAIAAHNRALEKAEQVGVKEEIKNAYKGLADAYGESKDFQQAYLFHQKYHSLYDSLYNEQSAKKMRQVAAVYESERKQTEIDLLIKNDQLQNSALQKEKLIKNSLIGGFIALALIALVLVISIAQKLKINKELKHQKAETQKRNEDLTLKNSEITKQKDEIALQSQRIKLKTEELERALEEINQQKEALIQLNATKDKFFSIVAHDIKSPLDSLSAFASLLANYIENMSKEEIKIIATNLDQSVRNTLQLTENLLTWARSQMNNLNYSPTAVNVKELIEQKVGIFKLVAENKKIQIKTDISSELMVFTDENHLRFVLRNLISNALKFTRPEGVITIKSEDIGEEVIISVSDNGVGITPEILPKIFRIDTKVSTRGTAGEKGTGLGLLLCKEFVERNGGIIKVESEVAKGSKFSFTVKKAEVLVMNS